MGIRQATVNEFGQRLKELIEFLVQEEEPKLVVLAERLKIPPQTLSAWRRGTQTSINKGYARLACCAKVQEETVREFLEGNIPLDKIKEERSENSPLAQILREVDKLSDQDQFELNWHLAMRLRNKQQRTALVTQETEGSLHSFIQFGFAEQTRLQRYFEAVKKTYGGSEGLIRAAIEEGAEEKSARSLVGDVLLGDTNRQYCAKNFKYFIPFLPRIVGWKGENPILDPSLHWNDFEEIVAAIKQTKHNRSLQQTCL